VLNVSNCHFNVFKVFSGDPTNRRSYVTMLGLSVVCLSFVTYVLSLNGVS